MQVDILLEKVVGRLLAEADGDFESGEEPQLTSREFRSLSPEDKQMAVNLVKMMSEYGSGAADNVLHGIVTLDSMQNSKLAKAVYFNLMGGKVKRGKKTSGPFNANPLLGRDAKSYAVSDKLDLRAWSTLGLLGSVRQMYYRQPASDSQDLAAFRGMSDLRELDMTGVNDAPTVLRSLGAPDKLKGLSLRQCPITDLNFLKQFSNLTSFDCFDSNQLADFSGLLDLPKLNSCFLQGIPSVPAQFKRNEGKQQIEALKSAIESGQLGSRS